VRGQPAGVPLPSQAGQGGSGRASLIARPEPREGAAGFQVTGRASLMPCGTGLPSPMQVPCPGPSQAPPAKDSQGRGDQSLPQAAEMPRPDGANKPGLRRGLLAPPAPPAPPPPPASTAATSQPGACAWCPPGSGRLPRIRDRHRPRRGLIRRTARQPRAASQGPAPRVRPARPAAPWHYRGRSTRGRPRAPRAPRASFAPPAASAPPAAVAPRVTHAPAGSGLPVLPLPAAPWREAPDRARRAACCTSSRCPVLAGMRAWAGVRESAQGRSGPAVRRRHAGGPLLCAERPSG